MIYLNSAATSCHRPPIIQQAFLDWITSIPGSEGRGGTDSMLQRWRETMSRFFQAPNPSRMIITSGATEGLNMAIYGLPLKNHHVISTVTEHNSVLRPLFDLEDRGDISLTLLPCDNEGYVNSDDLKAAIIPGTVLFIVNAMSNVTGAVQPLQEFGRICKKNQILFMVDGSQSAGSIPMNLSETEAPDIFVFTGHKALLGLPGSGGVYFSSHVEPKPWKRGGTGSFGISRSQPEISPYKWEAGTPPLAGAAAMISGIEFLESSDPDFLNRAVLLRNSTLDSLETLPGLRLLAARRKNAAGALFCVVPEKISPEETSQILLESFDIHTRDGLHCSPLIHRHLGSKKTGAVRISFSPWNTEQEAQRLVSALKRITGNPE